MKHQVLSIFLILSCSLLTFSSAAQEVTIFENSSNSGFAAFPANSNIQYGNYIELAGTNRQLTSLSVTVYIDGTATGPVDYTISFWSECPASADPSEPQCGDNGATLYTSFTQPATLVGGTTGLFNFDFPLSVPLDFSTIESDSIWVTFQSSRPDDTFVAFSETDASVGSFLSEKFSLCGSTDPTLPNACEYLFDTHDKVHFLFGINAIPHPFPPTTVDLSNAYLQTSTASVTLADLYVGDANYVPTQSITLTGNTNFTCADIGENIVTATVTYPGGAMQSFDAIVNVRDVSPPIISLPYPNFTETAAAGECGAVVITEEIAYTAWDNCNNFITGANAFGLPSGSFFPIGSTLCAHGYTDSYGNQSLDYYYVTVLPNPDDADTDGDGHIDICDMCPDESDVSLNFNRTGQNYVSVSNNTAFDFPNQDFSFEAWVKPDIITNHAILSKGDGTNSLTVYAYNIEADGRQSLSLGRFFPPALETMYSDEAVPLDQWSHVAVTLDKSGPFPVATFYLNGVPSSPKTYTIPTSGLFSNSLSPFQIGKKGVSLFTDGYFDGSIDEVATWSRVLTGPEIRASMNSFYDGSEADLVAYYRFNDANACFPNGQTTLIDSGPNQFDGSLINFSLGGSCVSNWAPGNDQLGDVDALCKEIVLESLPQDSIFTVSDLDNGSAGGCLPLQSLLINGQNDITLDLNDLGTQFIPLTATTTMGDESTCIAKVTVLKDICPGGDDFVDSDGGGLPDHCDCNPLDAFDDEIRLNDVTTAGMDFDGADDFLTIPNNASLVPTNTNSMTFEAWIKPDVVSGAQSIVSSANNLSVYNLAIYLLNDKVRVTATGGNLVLSNASVPVDIWTHVAVVFTANPSNPSASLIEIYINGQLDNTLVDIFEPSNLGNPILIGDINGADWTFDGTLDDVRFWSTARTAEEILFLKDTELYGSESNLVAYYNFNDGVPDEDNTALTAVEDLSMNGFDASLVNMAQDGTTSNWVENASSLNIQKLGQKEFTPCIDCPETLDISLDFDGVDDHIILTHDPLLLPTNTNSVTFEAWINPDNVTDIGMIASSGIFPSLNYEMFLFDNKITITGDGVGGLVSTSTIPVSQWTHVALVFDQTETRLYLNGNLDATRVEPLSSNNLGFDFGIGSQANGLPTNWNFEGKMDDVRYWTIARTPGQIENNYERELFGNEEGLAAYYNFSEGSPGGDNTTINTVSDNSGNGRNGTVNSFAKTGTESNWVSGSVFDIIAEGAAIHFDGSGDYLVMQHDPAFIPSTTNAMTIEAWIYSEKATGINLICSAGTFPDNNYNLFVSDGQLQAGGSGMAPINTTIDIPTFEWTHVALVYDLTEFRVYKNGTLENVVNQSFPTANLGGDISWGNQPNGSPGNWNFRGKMDEIRVWDYALTGEEINANILTELGGNENGLLAYYNFNVGEPEGDNTAIQFIEDQTFTGYDLVINGLAQTGTISNWVANAPVTKEDSDGDGKPNVCDNCFALKNLILENQTLQGTYKATQSITLGNNLSYQAAISLTLSAPEIIIPQDVQIPLSTPVTVNTEVCEDE